MRKRRNVTRELPDLIPGMGMGSFNLSGPYIAGSREGHLQYLERVTCKKKAYYGLNLVNIRLNRCI